MQQNVIIKIDYLLTQFDNVPRLSRREILYYGKLFDILIKFLHKMKLFFCPLQIH